MNVLPTFTRTCAHPKFPLRSLTRNQLQSQPQHQLRHLTTSTTSQAQPTNPSNSTTPASPSKTSPSPSPTTTPLTLATVSRTGTMQSTIQLTHSKQIFDPFLRKHYTRPHRLLAHDPFPSGYLREGDIVEFGPWTEQESAAKETRRLELQGHLIEKGVIRLRTRRGKERKLSDVGVKKRGPSFVVRRVLSPFGVPVDRRAGELGVESLTVKMRKAVV